MTLSGVKQGSTGLTMSGQGVAVKDAAALNALVQSLANSGAAAKDVAALKELVQSLTRSGTSTKDMAALKELVQSLTSSGAATKDVAALNALIQNLTGSGQGLIDPQMSVEMAKMRAEQAFLQATLDQTDLAIEVGAQTDRAELESTREVERQPEQVVDDKIWEMLLAWRQNSQLSAEQNLKQLQALFQMLLKEIMTNYRGEMQLQLLAQLDSLTMNAIKQMMIERYSDLLDFLGQYGRPGTNQQIMDSLFEAVAGRKPISLSSESFGPEGSLSSSKGQGIIYHKDSRGIRVNADYQNRIDRSENKHNQVADLLRRNNASGKDILTGREDFALQQGGRRMGMGTGTAGFSTRDISQAQQFIQYLRLNFPELDAEELPYTSEEFIGFSSGIMALKAQTFMDKKGMGSGMSSALKYALDSYIQSQFFQNAQALKQSSAFRDRSSSPSLKADDFQKVYHFMVNTYQDKKDAQAAVLAGLQKASESFHEKQKDSIFQKAARYFSDTGFFSHSEIDDLEREILDGWKAVCKDWNEFLKFAQIPADKSLRFHSNMDYNFYMAILLAYERATQAKDSTKIPKTIPYMVKWGTAIVIVGAGTVILYSMFF